MSRLIVLRLLALGAACLIALGIFWNQLFPVTSYWTEEQAKEYQDAFYSAHELQDAIKDGRLVADATQIKAARDRYLQIQGELKVAQTARARSGKYALVLGIFLLGAVAILSYFWTPPAPSERH